MNKGFIALTSLLIVTALIATLAIGMAVRSMTSSSLTLDTQELARAKALANACAEEAIDRLWSDLSYSGNETIMIGDESCQIVSVSGFSIWDHTIQAMATTNSGYVSKVVVEISSVCPETSIYSWREVADF